MKFSYNFVQLAFILSVHFLFSVLCAVASVFLWNALGFSYVLTFGTALALVLMLRITTTRITATFKE